MRRLLNVNFRFSWPAVHWFQDPSMFQCTVEGKVLHVQVVMGKVRLCETLKAINTQVTSISAPWTAPTPGSGVISASHDEYE